MLISEFARAAGLTLDTVRFYVRKGLLTPTTTSKGGSKPYQVFDNAQVEAARLIRTAQALGFSLREIGALSEEYRSGTMTVDRSLVLMTSQLEKLEDKAEQLDGMIAYIRSKVAWLKDGGQGPEPHFGDVACGSHLPALAADRGTKKQPKQTA